MRSFSETVEAFNGLLEKDSKFLQFSQTLFSEQAVHLDPNLLLPKQHDALYKTIEKLLWQLTPYFLSDNCFTIIDYLIEKFSIHKKLPVELVLMAIPYFESPLFTRVLQVADIRNTVFHFLYVPSNLPSSSPPREVIINRACNDLALFSRLCSIAHPTKFPCRSALNFFVLLATQVISIIGEEALAEINSLLLECLRDKEYFEVQSAALCIFAAAITRIPPINDKTHEDYWHKILTALLKHYSSFTLESVAKVIVLIVAYGHLSELGNRNVQRIGETPLIVSTILKLHKEYNVIPLLQVIVREFLRRSHVDLFAKLLNRIVNTLGPVGVTEIPELADFATQSTDANITGNRSFNFENLPEPGELVEEEDNTEDVLQDYRQFLLDFVALNESEKLFTALHDLEFKFGDVDFIHIIKSCIFNISAQGKNPFSFPLSLIFRCFERLSTVNAHSKEDALLLCCSFEVLIAAVNQIKSKFNLDILIPLVWYVLTSVVSPRLHVLAEELRISIAGSKNSQIPLDQSKFQQLSFEYLMANLSLWPEFVPSIGKDFAGFYISPVLSTIIASKQPLNSKASDSLLTLFSKCSGISIIQAVVKSPQVFNYFAVDSTHFQSRLIRILLSQTLTQTHILLNLVQVLISFSPSLSLSCCFDTLRESLVSLSEETLEDDSRFGLINSLLSFIELAVNNCTSEIQPWSEEIFSILVFSIGVTFKLPQSPASYLVCFSLRLSALLLSKYSTISVSSLTPFLSCCTSSSSMVATTALDALMAMTLANISLASSALQQALIQLQGSLTVNSIQKIGNTVLKHLVETKVLSLQNAVVLICDLIQPLPLEIGITLYSDMISSFNSALPLLYLFFCLYNHVISSKLELIDLEGLLDRIFDSLKNDLLLDFSQQSISVLNPLTDVSLFSIPEANQRQCLRVLASITVKVVKQSKMIASKAATLFRETLKSMCLSASKKNFSFVKLSGLEICGVVSKSLNFSEFLTVLAPLITTESASVKILSIELASNYFDSNRLNLVDADIEILAQIFSSLSEVFGTLALIPENLSFISAILKFVTVTALKFSGTFSHQYFNFLKISTTWEYNDLPFSLFEIYASFIGAVTRSIKPKILPLTSKIFTFIDLYFSKFPHDILDIDPLLLCCIAIVDSIPRLLSTDLLEKLIARISVYSPDSQLGISTEKLIDGLLNSMALSCPVHLLLSFISSRVDYCVSIYYPAQLLLKIVNTIPEEQLTDRQSAILSAIYSAFDWFRKNQKYSQVDQKYLVQISTGFLNYCLRLTEEELHSIWDKFRIWCSEPAAQLTPSLAVHGYGIHAGADPYVDICRWSALINMSMIVAKSLAHIAPFFLEPLTRHFVSTFELISDRSSQLKEHHPFLFVSLGSDLFVCLESWFSLPLSDDSFVLLMNPLIQSLSLVRKPTRVVDGRREAIFGSSFVTRHVIPTIGSLMSGTPKDTNWTLVNEKILTLCRSSSAELSNVAILCLIEIYERLREEALILFVPSKAVLSELAEQCSSTDAPIHRLLGIIQRLSGESLEDLLQ
ncbi:hypothetical protein RCL1_002792 [Eukaryota sp. TZLM3-RCL]